MHVQTSNCNETRYGLKSSIKIYFTLKYCSSPILQTNNWQNSQVITVFFIKNERKKKEKIWILDTRRKLTRLYPIYTKLVLHILFNQSMPLPPPKKSKKNNSTCILFFIYIWPEFLVINFKVQIRNWAWFFLIFKWKSCITIWKKNLESDLRFI